MATQLPNIYQVNTVDAATSMLSALVAVTTKLFGRDVTISESYDPEHPNDKFVELTVRVKMAPAEIVLAEGEWARQISIIAPRWDNLRLLILPV